MLPRKRITVERPTGGTRDRATAKFVPGPVETLALKASVQSLKPFEMASLPEGRRSRAAYKLYSTVRLRTIDEDNPDRVTIEEELYEVISVAPYQMGILPHFRCVVSKLEVAP